MDRAMHRTSRRLYVAGLGLVAISCGGERFESASTTLPAGTGSTGHPGASDPALGEVAPDSSQGVWGVSGVTLKQGAGSDDPSANNCGDGILDRGEACDEGPEGNLELGCSSECTLVTCGNGVEDPGEECDDGYDNDDSRPNACRSNCLFARCGDGVVDGYEECDGDAKCSVDCFRIECGNGRQDEGEECDSSDADCVDCRIARCGNRRVDRGEECEPPNTGMCGATCLVQYCGNERIDEGEECDPPQPGVCSQRCMKIECDNGRIDEGEGCEPPNTPQCNAECRPTNCGNGTREGDEECDPPEAGRCDGMCKKIECNNGRIDEGEDCEPPNTARCNSECHKIDCGNGITEQGEQCDPPAWGQCTAECREIRCGDGVLDEGEQCEPSISGDAACSASCTTLVAGMSDEYLYTFDKDVQQWEFYAASPERLASGASVTFDSQNGDVSPGTLKLQAPFDGSNQKIEVQVSLPTPKDWRGQVLKARVRLGMGLSNDTQNPGGIKMFAKAGDDWGYASGDWTYLKAGQGWQDVTLNMDAPILVPDEFDPSQVRQIGFELRAFNETTNVSAAVVYVDSVRY